MAEKGARCGKVDECSSIRLRLSRRDVNACALEKWYGRFCGSKGIVGGQDGASAERSGSSAKRSTFVSEWIDLPDEFVTYLGSDGIILPKPPSGDVSKLKPGDPRRPAPRSQFADYSDDEYSSDDNEEQDAPCFAELEKVIDAAIDRLRGECFIKLNWTSPRDSLGFGQKITSPGDVFMRLKSSDFVQHDLSHAYDNCFDHLKDNDDDDGSADSGMPLSPKLVLRRWSNLVKSMEFRCFVVKRQLLAIVQRDPHTFEEHLLPDGVVGSTVVTAVSAFFKNADLAYGLGEECENFVFDIYLDRNQKVWLVDFGPLPEILSENDECNADIQRCSDALLETPPHELLSWQALKSLADKAKDAQDASTRSGAVDVADAVATNLSDANAIVTSSYIPDATNTDTSAMATAVAIEPVYFVVLNRVQAQSVGNVLGAHRVPIELVTGELTQDIMDLAKAQLDERDA